MILCCGEALIDMIPVTSTAGEASFAPKAGGAVFNTAIALGRLGGDVGLFTGVSDDLFGALLQTELRASGVATTHLVNKKAPSTLAFVELNHGQAKYTFYSENAADTSLTPADVPRSAQPFDALFFGGISLCTDPSASTLQAFMRDHCDHSVIMLDPNIRPTFISDETSYRSRLTDMIDTCDILKVSNEDLNWLIPGTFTVEDQIRHLAISQPKLIFVTKGAEGCTVYHGIRPIADMPAKSANVADTIGAGDTFNAAILHSLAREGALTKKILKNPTAQILERALHLATSAAAITVSRSGANSPWKSELLR
ncbi:MAG: carbohydrate kinase family protein [Pikeienuella sp.]